MIVNVSLHLLVIFGLHEGVLDLFAAVDGSNQDKKGTAGNEQTERAGGCVAFFVWREC